MLLLFLLLLVPVCKCSFACFLKAFCCTPQSGLSLETFLAIVEKHEDHHRLDWTPDVVGQTSSGSVVISKLQSMPHEVAQGALKHAFRLGVARSGTSEEMQSVMVATESVRCTNAHGSREADGGFMPENGVGESMFSFGFWFLGFLLKSKKFVLYFCSKITLPPPITSTSDCV